MTNESNNKYLVSIDGESAPVKIHNSIEDAKAFVTFKLED